jgi:uncharacterized protein (DUF2062 family)
MIIRRYYKKLCARLGVTSLNPVSEAEGRNLWEKTLFVLKREFRHNASPFGAALSVSTGVFMGLFPIHGFQIALLVPLAVLLRLNKPLAFLGVSISTAPLLPFWLATGRWRW